MKQFYIKTFGCKVNTHDSSLIRERLFEEGFLENQKEDSEICILNTCAVTQEAGKEARRYAKKIKLKNPGTLVIVTGCGAQVETDLYDKNSNIDIVIGNSHKKNLPDILKNLQSSSISSNQSVFKSNIFKKSDVYSGHFSLDTNHTRAFLKIQDGCNSFCTFCIIPFARGKSQSLPIQSLVESVNQLVDQGVQEVVLTGVHIGDYNFEEKTLEDLIQIILDQTNIARIRLTSLEPIELNDKLLDLFHNERLCPHFHLSIQSVNSSVLRSMKRKYGREEVEGAFFKIHKIFPNAFVGMDIIAGFPQESDQNFEETYQSLKNSPWTRMHVFPYSPRDKTLSSRYKQWDRSLILKRASLLRNLSEFRYEENLKKQISSTKKVLIFKTDSKKGLSRDYFPIHLPPSNDHGKERNVCVKSFDKKNLSLEGSFI